MWSEMSVQAVGCTGRGSSAPRVSRLSKMKKGGLISSRPFLDHSRLTAFRQSIALAFPRVKLEVDASDELQDSAARVVRRGDVLIRAGDTPEGGGFQRLCCR